MAHERDVNFFATAPQGLKILAPGVRGTRDSQRAHSSEGARSSPSLDSSEWSGEAPRGCSGGASAESKADRANEFVACHHQRGHLPGIRHKPWDFDEVR